MNANSSQASLMMWAQRICSSRGAPPYQLLEIAKNATFEDAQTAFHKIARIAHPDLHRNALTHEELEMLTTAYAAVANAYETYRRMSLGSQPRIQPIKVESTAPPPTQRVPVTPSGAAAIPPGAAQQMSPKALVYYRKAELALKRGDLKSAVLQMKLAIATDPQSAFLRTALAEIEAELHKS